MSPDRRDPARQRPLENGKRATDPCLSTADCAEIVGFGDEDFFVGEIIDKRLEALEIKRPGKKTIRRVTPLALDAWRRKYTNWRGERIAG